MQHLQRKRQAETNTMSNDDFLETSSGIGHIVRMTGPCDFVFGSQTQEIVRIKPDGTVQVAKNLTLEDAAREAAELFWNLFAKHLQRVRDSDGCSPPR